MKKKELAARLSELAENQAELAGICRRLAANAEVVAVAVRNAEAVPEADLEAAVVAIHDVHNELLARFPPPDRV